MRRQQVIDRLIAEAATLRNRGVTALHLYGSTALDQATDTSDVDLFADVDYRRFGFVEFMDIRESLPGLLGRKVDFTTRAGLHPDLRERITRSAITVFDDATLDKAAAE
jgi:uncharacterized protein